MIDRNFLLMFAVVLSLLVTLLIGRFVVKLFWGI